MIIGTAGHIDHGKSALVTALTGRPVDRLIEEQRRGITIDLNFAPLLLPGLPPTGIVDVPGHEDLVRTMIAGASGIDLVLLVVDAGEGPELQTWEHLAIVEQLGIPRGIPIITKADLAEPDWIAMVREDLIDRLATSPVAFQEPAVVSAVTRQGIPELLERLRGEIANAAAKPRAARDGFRMPVDRAFSIAGTGTVLTGTPWTGELRVGDSVRLLPSGLVGRVRTLEAYGARVESAHPGQRAAVGVAGLERSAIRRGETLVCDRLPWRPTSALDVELALLPRTAPLRRQSRVRVLLGTSEVLARVYPRGELAPGTPGLARLALEAPLLGRGGDRFVLRSYSPVTTIGGGRVLDPLPPRRTTWSEALTGSPEQRLQALVERRAEGVLLAELPILLGLPPDSAGAVGKKNPGTREVGAVLIEGAKLDRLAQSALQLVREYHREHPELAGISTETLRRSLSHSPAVIQAVLDALIRQGKLIAREGTVALSGFVPRLVGSPELMTKLQEHLDAAGLEAPSVAELEERLGQSGLLPVLRRMAALGQVVMVGTDRFFSTAATERFVARIRELAGLEPVTPARLRDSLGISRKYLIPLLEWSDRSGVTRRVGDTRVLA